MKVRSCTDCSRREERICRWLSIISLPSLLSCQGLGALTTVISLTKSPELIDPLSHCHRRRRHRRSRASHLPSHPISRRSKPTPQQCRRSYNSLNQRRYHIMQTSTLVRSHLYHHLLQHLQRYNLRHTLVLGGWLTWLLFVGSLQVREQEINKCLYTIAPIVVVYHQQLVTVEVSINDIQTCHQDLELRRASRGGYGRLR